MNKEQLDASNTLLADMLAAALKTKQLHWTMRGRNFISVHTYFDEVHAFLQKYSDELAERIVAIGGIPDGTKAAVFESEFADASLTTYPVPRAIESILPHLYTITEDAHDIAFELDNDLVSQDLLVELSRELDKIIWFLESELGEAGLGII